LNYSESHFSLITLGPGISDRFNRMIKISDGFYLVIIFRSDYIKLIYCNKIWNRLIFRLISILVRMTNTIVVDSVWVWPNLLFPIFYPSFYLDYPIWSDIGNQRGEFDGSNLRHRFSRATRSWLLIPSRVTPKFTKLKFTMSPKTFFQVLSFYLSLFLIKLIWR